MAADTQIRMRQIPLSEALAAIDRVEPVEPREIDVDSAAGLTLASDAGTAGTLRLTGARLRRIDVALLAAEGASSVRVRTPRIAVVTGPAGKASPAAGALIASAIAAEGGIARAVDGPLPTAAEAAGWDAAIVIAGDGELRDESSARLVAERGRISFDGIALNPGGASAFGYVDARPVLLLPGKFDAALAAWLVVGRRLLARLAFRLIEEQPFLLELARPVPSARGITDVVPVRRRAAQVEPLTGDAWSAQSIARADGWILVPADSDGLAAGSKVQMRPWP